MSKQLIEIWGYDPFAGLKYIGVTEKVFPYRHPDGNTHTGRFEFYYNPQTGDIDVCHAGCNGSIFSGKEAPDGTVTFRPPLGYPDTETFAREFKTVRDKFLAKRNESNKQQ